jgi:hypothetical protein
MEQLAMTHVNDNLVWTEKHLRYCIAKRLTPTAINLYQWLLGQMREGSTETIDLHDFQQFVTKERGKAHDLRVLKAAVERLIEADLLRNTKKFTNFVYRWTLCPLNHDLAVTAIAQTPCRHDLSLIPTCIEEVALIDFSGSIPVLEIDGLYFPMQTVQKAASVKGTKCLYFLFGLDGHPKALSYVGRTKNLKLRLGGHLHKRANFVAYIETQLCWQDMEWIEDYLIYRLNPLRNSRYNFTTNLHFCILKPPSLKFLC